ncbi:hypothetical protein PUN28_000050 [Cardiocondyla obscurior]|uniref:Uncharacterized protein n=1 Tax=Cardiocondyla obscurior TaxID=286306 RepID=A0AAW2GXH8_9HYME
MREVKPRGVENEHENTLPSCRWLALLFGLIDPALSRKRIIYFLRSANSKTWARFMNYWINHIDSSNSFSLSFSLPNVWHCRSINNFILFICNKFISRFYITLYFFVFSPFVLLLIRIASRRLIRCRKRCVFKNRFGDIRVFILPLPNRHK